MPRQIYLPTASAIVTSVFRATDAMWAWMRDVTKAVTDGGGPSPADATYFLKTANAVIPNGRVGTDTASITLDYASAGLVKWNLTETYATVQRGALVTLTNAQIKALPSTPITVLPAPGASRRYSWLALDVQSDFSSGAYTNVSPDGWIVARFSGGEAATNYVANDSTIPITFLDYFTSALDLSTTLMLYQYSEPVNGWGNLPAIFAWHTNESITLTASNGLGNFTGGHASNVIRIIPYFITTAVS